MHTARPSKEEHAVLPPEATTASLSARIDRVPTTRRHLVWISILGLAYFIEIFDNISFSFVAPSVRADLGLDLSEVGLVISAVFVGALIGAVLGGRLSDRFGRRPVLIVSCIVFSIGSLISAVSPTWEILALSRVVTGLGMQAAVGVLLVIVSELFPRLVRGRFFAALTFVGFVSSPVTAVIALNIVPASPGAWRWVFAIGGLGIIVAILVAFLVPETVHWQEAHGRTEAASRTVNVLEAAALKSGAQLSEPEVSSFDSGKRGTLRELLRGEALRRLVVTALAFSIYLYCLYGLSAWIPTILTDRGMTETAALQFMTVLSLGQILGPLALFFVADRVQRKTVIFIGSIVTAAALVWFALTADPTLSLISAFIAYLAATSMTTPFYTYIPEVFSTSLRGMGVGIVNGMGRVAGVLSGVTIAAIYTAWGFEVMYLILAGIFLLTGTIVMVFGIRTTQQSLDNI